MDITAVEQAWQEFVERAGGRQATGDVYPVFSSSREAFQAGYASAGMPAKLTIELTFAPDTWVQLARVLSPGRAG